MTEQPLVKVDAELSRVHSVSDVEAVGEVVVTRGRGQPRKERLPKEKKKGVYFKREEGEGIGWTWPMGRK